MPTPYTGNPTGVQSPASAPAVNNAPVVALPVDGDPVNAAEFVQGYKVSVDNIAFLQQIAGGTRSALGIVIDGVGGSTSTSAGGSHVVVTGTNPTIAAGAGAGTGAAATIAGNDTVGTIQMVMGTSPSTSSTFCTVTLANVRPNTVFRVFLQPNNSQASALTTAQQIFPFTETAGSFTLESGTSAIGAGTYQWNYWVVG